MIDCTPLPKGPLRCGCDDQWLVARVAEFVGHTSPALFVECFAYTAETTLNMLLTKSVHRGLLVVGDPYLEAFWREALKTDNLIRKAQEFEATEANVEEVIGNPDRDPSFWILVKNRCGRRGRLDRAAFLEWNVSDFWFLEEILESLLTVRSLSDRLDVVEGRSVEILEQYTDAMAFLHYPFDMYDKWNEALCGNWNSDHEQEKLFQILASRKGPWMIPRASEKICGWSEMKGVGAAWMVVTKMMRPRFFREAVLVSDPLFAADQVERSIAGEKQLLICDKPEISGVERPRGYQAD